MKISFQADNAFTRKHARLIWQHFFPFYPRSVRMQWYLFILMGVLLWQFFSLLMTQDNEHWLLGWHLPQAFAAWSSARVVVLLGLLVCLGIAQVFAVSVTKQADRRFVEMVPREETTVEVSGTAFSMRSASFEVTVPLQKIRGIAVDRFALAIGFSGTGLVIPHTAFASQAEQKEFIRMLASHLTPEALQRSSETVRRVL